MQRYEVTCLKCKKADTILVKEDEHTIVAFDGGMNTNLLAGRWWFDIR